MADALMSLPLADLLCATNRVGDMRARLPSCSEKIGETSNYAWQLESGPWAAQKYLVFSFEKLGRLQTRT